MKNKIDDLRNHLFATLEALQDDTNPMDLERARTVALVAQTVINSAKAEVDFINAIGKPVQQGLMQPDDEMKPEPGSRPRLVGRG